jgi:hypothetical protein
MRKTVLLPLLLSLAVVSPASTVFIKKKAAAGCAGTLPTTTGNVLLWVNFETDTTTCDHYDASSNPDGVEYCPSDDTWSLYNTADIGTANVLQGSYSLRLTGTGLTDGMDYAILDFTDTVPYLGESEGSCGFLLEVNYYSGAISGSPILVTGDDSGGGQDTNWRALTFTSDWGREMNVNTTRTVYDSSPRSSIATTYFISFSWEDGGTDNSSAYRDGSLMQSDSTAFTPPAWSASGNTFSLGQYNTNDKGIYDLDAVVCTDSADDAVNLYDIVCGETTACTSGQEGNYCNP